MNGIASIRTLGFCLVSCLLLCAAANAQTGLRRFTYPEGLYASKIVSLKTGGLLSVFVVPNADRSNPFTYSSIVQRQNSSGAVLWSKRFTNLSVADALEAVNGDLVFSGSQWQGAAFGSGLNAFVLRTAGNGSFLWRQNVSFARAAMPDTVLGKEQRLAETGTGKLYFQCRDASQPAGTFVAFYFNPNGSLIWSRHITLPAGVVFTDLVSAFDNSLLLSGTLTAGGVRNTALLCVDTLARLRYIRTFQGGDVSVTRILKDETKRQYWFCGEGAADASGSYAIAMKTDADIESLAYLQVRAVVPDLFRCRNLPTTFGADADGNVYCWYAGRAGSFGYRKLTSGDSAYVQLPVCKFDTAGLPVWRKRYALPVDKAGNPFVTAAPAVVFAGGALRAMLQTGGETTASLPATGWLMATDTAGSPGTSCVVTDESFTTKLLRLVTGGIRANVITAGLAVQASTVFDVRDQPLPPLDTCAGRQKPRSRFRYLKGSGGAGPSNIICTRGTVSFFEEAFNEPRAWQWIFPPGVDASNADSSCYPDVYNVSFATPGTYAVQLVVENAQGHDTATQVITVMDPPPAPALGGRAVLCPGDSVQLVYKDPVYVTHAFYAVGGSFYSTADTVVIKTPGTFVCAVFSPCGTARDTLRVQAAQQPTAAFVTPLSCGSLTVAFANTSLANGNPKLSYQWDFFDKNGVLLGSSQTDNPSFTYPAFDVVKARLIVQSTLACTRPDTVEKTFVLHPKPVASFTFTESCGRTDVVFNGAAPVAVGNVASYAWTFGDGGTSNAPSPTHTYPTAGFYPVSFTATSDAGCTSNTVVQTVTVRAKPAADFTYGNDACEGKPFALRDASTVNGSAVASYYWRIAASGQVYTTAVINPVIGTAGPATVSYAVTTAQGCASDTLKRNILVESIPLASIGGGNGCAGDSLSFSSVSNTAVGSIQAYQWTVSNGLSSVRQNPRFFFGTAGVYTVTHKVVSGHGCASPEAVTNVVVYPLPQPSFTYSVPCLNALVQFTNTTLAASGNAWQWTVNGNPFSTQSNAAYAFALPGAYAVTLQTVDGNGCTAGTRKTVTVDDFRLRLTAARNPVLPGEPVWLQTAAALPYSVTAWTPAALFPLQTSKAQRAVTERPLPVEVFAQSAQGCKDSASLLVEVFDLDDVWVPSAFTPNGDGRNDLLYVAGKGISEMAFTVYNRWGEAVFASRDKTVGWDGTSRGKPLAAGTYVYVLKAKKTSGQSVERKGTVTLIR